MPGYDNIKDANSRRTPGERRELARAAGIESGKARRRKADFRKTLNMLLTAEIEDETWAPVLKELGVDCTLESAMLMAQIKAAINGNLSAAQFVAQYAGQSSRTDADEEEQRIRTDRARRARDQETGDNDGKEDHITDFLKAMNPTEEDIRKLFPEEEADENQEETGEV